MARRICDVQMTIRLPREVHDAVEKEAELRGCSNTGFVRYCVVNTLRHIRGE